MPRELEGYKRAPGLVSNLQSNIDGETMMFLVVKSLLYAMAGKLSTWAFQKFYNNLAMSCANQKF